ncbi:DsbA family protein [Thalassotalea mangrovi]|uniref:DsbA family protein n=1 Tax=Thalassotalea mangrovi TaxID=2572245 RepID=A0A4U1B2Q4_9GAMM|nr:DsbA family protein [Thalassotalea mangrovi]TKB43202.1 DsbA family protein [Thalassotalea mangrovi]
MKRLIQIFSVIFFSLSLVSCSDSADNAEMKQQLSELQEQVSILAKQVEEIHEIATRSQRPNTKQLGTLENFNRNNTIPRLGDDEAKIAIIEFSDFQCPYCKRFIEQTFPSIQRKFIDAGKTAYFVRDFPLSFHPQARGAAIAGHCAHQQQKYWQLREVFFNNIAKLSDDYYRQAASSLDIDMDAFNDCIESATEDNINEDIALARSLGVTGTPAFVIGKIEGNSLIDAQLLIGAQPQSSFEYVIAQLSKGSDTDGSQGE